ncbi:transglutaminase domain-containing protein [Blastopirellula retiformator]|uniref:Transglutaminase-like superfamily protein n=1 Tax=Blastopirellula retiformator TaxID=2527970 RepID=A0A5C5UU83_9BACT|nr:transglutaminase domain-containing protein [Blastopirellula retiformator]TWT29638.1 Transglutaminase-like superfamily protein [Blastopirellula retiformator]
MGNPFLIRLNAILVTLATVALQLSLHRGALGTWWDWLEVAVVLIVSLLAGRVIIANADPQQTQPTAGAVILLVGALLLHLVIEAALAGFAPALGKTMELQTSLALRNLMIAAAVLAYFPACLRLSLGLSFVLTCFAFIFEIHASITAVCAVYAMIGLWWLIGDYWDRIQGSLPSSAERTVPKTAGLAATGLALLFALTLFCLVDRDQAAIALSGFMPSSGGNQYDSEAAHSGVGDGNDLVAGTEDAMSFGPTESEVFLESQMPSLYDVFNDTYDVPVKSNKKKERQRAVALAPDRLQHRHQKVARSEQSGKEFSLVRKRANQQRRQMEDRTTHALLYVKGRVPQHLRTNIYDRIEGNQLIEAADGTDSLLLLSDIDGKPWIDLPCLVNDSDVAYVEESMLKFINLNSPRIPSPSHFSQLHIPDVDRPDFFRWTDDGVLRLDAARVPSSTVMRQRFFLVADETLRSDRYSRKFAGSRQAPPEDSSTRIRELAEIWTAENTPGWEAITSVVDKLRSDFELQRVADVEFEEDAIEQFLLKTKRGPDYLFAASAALLLRELGYSVRIVSGFYASPDRFVAASGQTPIYTQDAHFWLEVSDGVNWHTVDPSPGYETLAPPRDFKTLVAEAIWSGLLWCWSQKWTLTLSAMLLVAGWLLRGLLFDGAARVADFWTALCDERRRVLHTLYVIQVREKWLGPQRPKGATLQSWLSQKTIVAGEETLRRQAIALCSWALYGGGSTCPVAKSEVDSLRRFASKLSRRSHTLP